MALHGIILNSIVLHSIACYSISLYDIAWYSIVIVIVFLLVGHVSSLLWLRVSVKGHKSLESALW